MHVLTFEAYMTIGNFQFLQTKKAFMIKTVFLFKAVSAHLPILYIIINTLVKDESDVNRALLYSKMY